MTAYYNEHEPATAEWLRELIRDSVIAPGVVDERSIEDVRPDDLRGFTQCHFFAGIGVWSYALRRAGWADDRPIWTGSCPCQPFSAAGKGAAFADERHLWPAFGHLIRERKPAVVLGEQVASKAVDDWIDLVHADLEAMGYAFGSVPFPSAGVGAPHIRDRNYWVAHANSNAGRQGRADVRGRPAGGNAQPRTGLGSSIVFGRLADADGERLDGFDPLLQWDGARRVSGPGLETVGRGPVAGFWRDSDWLRCRDDRWRPVEPGTFPLVTGASARVLRLRGYGNAINAGAAQAWIETVMECLP